MNPLMVSMALVLKDDEIDKVEVSLHYQSQFHCSRHFSSHLFQRQCYLLRCFGLDIAWAQFLGDYHAVCELCRNREVAKEWDQYCQPNFLSLHLEQKQE